LLDITCQKKLPAKVNENINLAYQKTGVKPDQIGVIELHDCFSTNELITY
jgi:sterol carrier protein 2